MAHPAYRKGRQLTRLLAAHRLCPMFGQTVAHYHSQDAVLAFFTCAGVAAAAILISAEAGAHLSIVLGLSRDT